MRPTLLSAAILIVAGHGASAFHIYPRQNFLSTLKTFFGGGDDSNDPPTTRPGRQTRTTSTPATTTPAPVTTTNKPTTIVTTTASPSKPTTSSLNPTSTTTINTSTITSTPTLTTTTPPSTTSSTSTSPPTTTALPSDPRPPQQHSSGGISPAGIAVAVIFSIVIVLLIAWLIFRYNPRCRAWWQARQAEKYKKRSYRDALDGPDASGAGAGGMIRNRAGLQSFFAPRTARLGGGREIKRKTVNWGAPRRGFTEIDSNSSGSGGVKEAYQFSNNPANHVYGQGLGLQRGFSGKDSHNNRGGAGAGGQFGGEKVPLAELAGPMGVTQQQQQQQQRQLNGSNFAAPLPPVPAVGSQYRQNQTYDISPVLTRTNTERTSPGVMSPISPISNQGVGGLSSNPSFAHTDRNGNARNNQLNGSRGAASVTTSASALPTPPPQVKLNGHVVYELE